MVNGIRFSQSLCSQLANLNMEYVFFSVFNQIAAIMGNSRRFLRSVLFANFVFRCFENSGTFAFGSKTFGLIYKITR